MVVFAAKRICKPSATGHAFPRIDATYENMLPLMKYINPVIYSKYRQLEFDTTLLCW